MSIKEIIKASLRRRGIVLKRFNVFQSEIHQVVKACDRANCKVLFDIGANTGQFAQECFEAGYSKTIISVEPQSAAHAKLIAVAARNRNWTIAPRCAIGDVAGKTSIHVAENSVSSSLLDVTDISVTANARTRFIGEEDVDVVTMDELVSQYVLRDDPLAFKIDTQGNEAAVLRGARQSLDNVGVLYLEMSLVPLYRDAPLFEDLYRAITELGFRCIGIFPGFTDVETYEVLQVNSLFTKVTGASR